MNSITTKSINQLTIKELDKELMELENSYSHGLKDNVDIYSLNRFWARIKTLKLEKERRERTIIKQEPEQKVKNNKSY